MSVRLRRTRGRGGAVPDLQEGTQQAAGEVAGGAGATALSSLRSRTARSTVKERQAPRDRGTATGCSRPRGLQRLPPPCWTQRRPSADNQHALGARPALQAFPGPTVLGVALKDTGPEPALQGGPLCLLPTPSGARRGPPGSGCGPGMANESVLLFSSLQDRHQPSNSFPGSRGLPAPPGPWLLGASGLVWFSSKEADAPSRRTQRFWAREMPRPHHRPLQGPAPALLPLPLQRCRRSSVDSGHPEPIRPQALLPFPPTQHPASYRDARGAHGPFPGPEPSVHPRLSSEAHGARALTPAGSRALREGSIWEGQAFLQSFSPRGWGAPHGQQTLGQWHQRAAETKLFISQRDNAGICHPSPDAAGL